MVVVARAIAEKNGLGTCRNWGDTARIFQTAKHDLNPIAYLVSPFVVLNDLASRFPSRDAKHYSLFYNGFTEPICILSRSPNSRSAVERVIPQFLMGRSRRIQAAVFSFIAGVIPPMPMLGSSLL